MEVYKNGKFDYFNIPDYQRGYKWDASDVGKLLNDLKKFEEGISFEEAEQQVYCEELGLSGFMAGSMQLNL